MPNQFGMAAGLMFVALPFVFGGELIAKMWGMDTVTTTGFVVACVIGAPFVQFMVMSKDGRRVWDMEPAGERLVILELVAIFVLAFAFYCGDGGRATAARYDVSGWAVFFAKVIFTTPLVVGLFIYMDHKGAYTALLDAAAKEQGASTPPPEPLIGLPQGNETGPEFDYDPKRFGR